MDMSFKKLGDSGKVRIQSQIDLLGAQKSFLEAYKRGDFTVKEEDIKNVLTLGVSLDILARYIRKFSSAEEKLRAFEGIVNQSEALERKTGASLSEEVDKLNHLLAAQGRLLSKAADDSDFWRLEAEKYKAIATGKVYLDDLLDEVTDSEDAQGNVLEVPEPPKKVRHQERTLEQIKYLRCNPNVGSVEGCKILGINLSTFYRRRKQARQNIFLVKGEKHE
jgi:hypothetical protein